MKLPQNPLRQEGSAFITNTVLQTGSMAEVKYATEAEGFFLVVKGV